MHFSKIDTETRKPCKLFAYLVMLTITSIIVIFTNTTTVHADSRDDSEVDVSRVYATTFNSQHYEFIDRYVEIAQSLGYQYGIPWEAVMAQGMIESTCGTSPMARERNNLFGIGAYDSNTGKALHYESPEDCWEGYFRNIEQVDAYRNHGAFDHPLDPYAYIFAIASTYASNPNYKYEISSYIISIENYCETKGYASSRKYAELKEYEAMEARREEARAKAEAEAAAAIPVVNLSDLTVPIVDLEIYVIEKDDEESEESSDEKPPRLDGYVRDERMDEVQEGEEE